MNNTSAIWFPGSTRNVLSSLASIIIPGSGQLIQGRTTRAVVYFALSVLLWLIILGWIIHIISGIDAANYYHKNQETSEEFHQENSTSTQGIPPPLPPQAPEIPEELIHAIVLGLRGKVTMVDVRSAYRKSIAEYHPDKVAHLGDKLRKVAADEAVKINTAYSYFVEKYEKV